VVSDVAGAGEVVTDGVTGLLTAPGNAPALARCVERLLGDATLRRRLSQAGHRLVLQQFGWDKVVSDTLALYDRVLAQRGAAPA
jgi:glycosyltransferase involved in cell wall biosynthesis